MLLLFWSGKVKLLSDHFSGTEEEVLYSREHARNEMHWALRFLRGPAKRDEAFSADLALPYYGRDPSDIGVRGQKQTTSRTAASVEPLRVLAAWGRKVHSPKCIECLN